MPLPVSLRNGENFDGTSLIYNENSFTRFDHWDGQRMRMLEGRIGDRPAIKVAPQTPGLQTVLYESTTSVLTYREWEKFIAFVEHKDFDGALEAHDTRGLSREEFGEAYSRHAKMLFCSDICDGQDRIHGLETEIVALTNPYTPDLKSMQVQVYYRSETLPDQQVEIFARDGQGVKVSTVKTDSAGVATIPIEPGTEYLLDAVTLREPSPDLAEARDVVWETLWAALTFKTPD